MKNKLFINDNLNNMKVVKDENRTHLIIYNLLWCPKRRKPILDGEVKKECELLIRARCEEKGWKIIELKINPDHINLIIRVFPSVSADEVIQECKGITGKLRNKYADLKKLPSLWTRNYFACTEGNINNDLIESYIASQKGV